jgi:hypothetical protein
MWIFWSAAWWSLRISGSGDRDASLAPPGRAAFFSPGGPVVPLRSTTGYHLWPLRGHGPFPPPMTGIPRNWLVGLPRQFCPAPTAVAARKQALTAAAGFDTIALVIDSAAPPEPAGLAKAGPSAGREPRG